MNTSVKWDKMTGIFGKATLLVFQNFEEPGSEIDLSIKIELRLKINLAVELTVYSCQYVLLNMATLLTAFIGRVPSLNKRIKPICVFAQ